MPIINSCRMASFLFLLLILPAEWGFSQNLFAQIARSGPGPKLSVRAIRVGGGPEVRIVQGMGSIRCDRELELGFEESGVVSEAPVKQGDMVEKGQALAKLESSVVAAQMAEEEFALAKAEAEVRYFSKELERRRALAGKAAISDTEMQRAILELEKSQATAKHTEARIKTIQTRLARRVLRAPISGLVSEYRIDVGSVAGSSSNKMVGLHNCRKVYADLELGEKIFSSLEPGMRVKIAVDALGERTFFGVLFRKSPAIDKKKRTFTAIVEIDNPQWVLRSGMFVRAEIAVPEAKKAVWIPSAALVRADGPAGSVFVVKDGVALKRDVRIGERSGDKAHIVNGLAHGEVLVVAGQDQISELDEVSVEMVDQRPER